MLLTMSALQLRTYYFFVTSDHNIRRQGLLRAYTTSVTLVSASVEANENSDFIKYAPNGYGQFLIMSAILIMKIVHSSYSKYIDIEGGKRAFDTVIRTFKKSSLEDNDIRGRISKILTNLWSFHQSSAPRLAHEEPKLNIKTRMGASLLHDSLWTWREEFGGQRDALRTAIPGNATQEYKDLSGRPAFNNADASAQGSAESRLLEPANFNSAIPTPLEETNFDFDAQDMEWLWDVGVPSFLPTEFSQQPSPRW